MSQNEPVMRERAGLSLPGFAVLLILLASGAATAWALYRTISHAAFLGVPPPIAPVLGLGIAGLILFVCLFGFFIVNPNEAVVLQFFGRYVGTVREQGLRWTNPLYSKKGLSVRIRNFESAPLKVNDLEGNPIEIAAVIVWRVTDTAEAVFQVDNYVNYVQVQAETALRGVATRFPYDAHEDNQLSLRGSSEQVAEQLKRESHDRLARAGVEVIEARITKLAYAPEIAHAMLQRQQAAAIIAARQRIVEGAVGMVEMALQRLAEHHTVELDEERKAAMVSNLLVVLCGDRAAQPVVNTGTLYTG